MKTWRAQLAGAVLIAVMAIALGVEASHLHRGIPPPGTIAATPFPISHHTCARAEGDNTGLTQASDGTFSACLRVGAVAAGHDQVAARRLAGKGVPDSGAVNRPGDWITLAPASGPPGSLVTVTGYVAGATPGQSRADHAPLCWAACDALTGYVDISWSPSQAGRFTAQFTAPAAPWFAGGKIAPLRAGRYAIVFPCLPGFEKPSGLCSGSRLVAHFDLTGSGSGLCTTGASCAILQTSPAEGPPGTLVAVDGWAPLTGLNGTGFIDVAIEGQPQGKPGSASATPLIASTPFTVTGAPGWESLASMHPLSVQRTGLAPFGVDPGNANRFAYCADGVVDITSNAGRSWSAVPLAGVHTASAATNYPVPWSFSGSPRPTCDAVFLDPKNAGTMYAVFSTVPRNSGPPPFNLVAYVSRNFGRTWQPVPVPGGSEMGRFDGFRVDGSAAQALFWKSDAATYVPDPNAFIVQETADGGRTWHVGALHCPVAGPCLALGPQDNGRCQAIGDWESILTSANSGRSWSIPGWPNRLGACSTSELVGLAGGGVAALDGSSQYPLVVSTDGGATWAALALPPLPGAAGDLGGCCGWVLQMLPDGRLLVVGSAWYLLAPGATQWCSPTTMPAGQPSADPGMTPMVMGDRLWWVDSTRNGPGAFTSSAKSVPTSGLHC